MKISKAHKKFADLLENQRALENPEEFLGPNWIDVLNFWFFLDTLTIEQMKSINDAFYSLSSDERQLAAHTAIDAPPRAYAAWLAAGGAAAYAAGYVAGYATWEIMGSHILKEQGKSLFFLPMVLNV